LVEQSAVNTKVVGSRPTFAAILNDRRPTVKRGAEFIMKRELININGLMQQHTKSRLINLSNIASLAFLPDYDVSDHELNEKFNNYFFLELEEVVADLKELIKDEKKSLNYKEILQALEVNSTNEVKKLLKVQVSWEDTVRLQMGLYEKQYPWAYPFIFELMKINSKN
jgi:hypothetical protein